MTVTVRFWFSLASLLPTFFRVASCRQHLSQVYKQPSSARSFV